MPIHHFQKLRKHRVSLEIGNFAGFQLQLELVCDEGDEFRIGRFSLGIWHYVKSPTIFMP